MKYQLTTVLEIHRLLKRSLRFNFLSNANLSRTCKFISSCTPFAIISADKHSDSKERNTLRQAELVMALKSHAKAGVHLVGYYQEMDASQQASETFFFVPYADSDIAEFRSLIQGILVQFDLESALFSDSEQVGYLTRSSFNPKTQTNSLTPSSLMDIWGTLRCKTFTSIESGITDTINGAWQRGIIGLISDVSLKDCRAALH